MTVTELDRLDITLITDNYYDALRPDAPVTKRFRTRPGMWIHAEHGLACFVETFSGDRAGRFMFDYGLDARGVKGNMEVLGIDLGDADGFGLSHGHFDHWGALVDLLAANRAKIRAGTPLYLGEEAFETRYLAIPETGEKMDIGTLDRAALEALGLSIVEVASPTEVIPGGYFTGRIDRVTEYEKTPPVLLVKREDTVAPDTFPGERAMAFAVRDKGLVVLSGCAHRGIINTVKCAQEMTGIERVHAVLGGFHLVNAPQDIIEKTIADMKAIDPDYIVPAHCSGFEATSAFAREMSDRFILSTAGTRYTFTS